MFSVHIVLICAFGLHIATVNSFLHYQTLIPNGQDVPSPCEHSELWTGVGHKRPAGGGARNPFGIDFAKNDHVSAKFVRNFMLQCYYSSIYMDVGFQ